MVREGSAPCAVRPGAITSGRSGRGWPHFSAPGRGAPRLRAEDEVAPPGMDGERPGGDGLLLLQQAVGGGELMPERICARCGRRREALAPPAQPSPGVG